MSEDKSTIRKRFSQSEILAIVSKKGKSFTEYFEVSSPIIENFTKVSEIISEFPFLSVFKFIIKLLEEVTKIDDPREIGFYACKIALLDSLQMIFNSDKINSPIESKRIVKEVEIQLRTIKFVDIKYINFDLEYPQEHQSFTLMMAQTNSQLMTLGLNERARNEIEYEIKDIYSENLRLLFTRRDTSEKFKPFKDYLLTNSTPVGAKENLRKHREYQVWQFESAPVLGKEPFALKDVYIESECGQLTWGEIIGKEVELPGRLMRSSLVKPKLDPFLEKNGGRHNLLNVVIKLISNKNYIEPIIIQGAAGSGKTSFTLKLCRELIKLNLIPIRIRLRDINLNWNLIEDLPLAIRLSDRPPQDKNTLLDYKIFRESGSGDFDHMSRYVVILDGWDELSASASEDFTLRVDRVISKILDKLNRNSGSPLPVKIILTGRPSEHITTSQLLTTDTAVLTMRNLTNEQLQQFVNNIHNAVLPNSIKEFKDKIDLVPLNYFSKPSAIDFEDWKYFDKSKFDSILKKYHHEKKPMELMGLPLLAHLTAHLIKTWKGEASELIENETTLYRNLINLTCLKAGKAQTDESMSYDDTKNQPTFRGEELRKLLWTTAGAMSVFDIPGNESISYDELKLRIKLNKELRDVVDPFFKTNWLSSLLISFYFKTSIKELGCEFSHKSFREYLYAEAIVNELKEFGFKVKKNVEEYNKKLKESERITRMNFESRQHDWVDFSEDDERFDLSRSLALLLAPQWLKDKVIVFLRDLIEWEIMRAKDPSQDKDTGLVEDPLDLEYWLLIRDVLSDVWGWWDDGVHLRLQVEYDVHQGEDVYRKEAFVNELIRKAMPLSIERNLPPPTSNELDAHLGESLCYLNVFLHNSLRDFVEDQPISHKYQTIINGEKRFKPSTVRFTFKGKSTDFYNVIGRINSIGNRPSGIFPRKMDLSAVDLSNCFLSGVNLEKSHLENTNLEHSNLDNSKLDYAQLISANIDNATFYNASLYNTKLYNTSLRFVYSLTKEQIDYTQYFGKD